MKENMKVKTLFTLLLLWAMAVGAWAENQGTLYVHLKDGSKVQFLLPVHKPVVSCANGYLSVSYQEYGREDFVAFERDEVENLTVGMSDANAVEDVQKEDDQRIVFDLTRTGVVRVSGLLPTDRLQVFSLDGKRVGADISRHECEAVVDLSQAPRGIYLVSVSQRFTFKLMKP